MLGIGCEILMLYVDIRSWMSCILAAPTYQRYDTVVVRGRSLKTDIDAAIKAELKQKLSSMYEVRDEQCIFVFGFRTQVCFALPYL